VLQDFISIPRSDVSAGKLGPSASVTDLKTFFQDFPPCDVDAARARLEPSRMPTNGNGWPANTRKGTPPAYRSSKPPERLSKATRSSPSDAKARSASDWPARKQGLPPPHAAPHEHHAGSVQRSQLRRARQRARTADQRTSSQRTGRQGQVPRRSASGWRAGAAFEADKARLADERRALERAMSESLAKAQAERERAENGRGGNRTLAGLCARSAANDSAGARAACASTCQEINARAQIGDISEADRDILKHGCR